MKKTKWTDSMSLLLSSVIVKVLAVIFLASSVYAPFGLKAHTIQVPECNPAALLITFYFCAVLAFTALYFLDRLLKNIRKNKAFIDENVRILRILSWCCYFVGIATAIYSIWEYYFMVIAAAAAFFGLILRVLKNVFRKAVEIREENDGTI
ncbi:MAG: DUF2975 domain-containing protein [Oscillospiraceae bacterium]|nr:DUF2975 domain-containing protein [Oscillospiraceae bacterium]